MLIVVKINIYTRYPLCTGGVLFCTFIHSVDASHILHLSVSGNMGTDWTVTQDLI